jgi:hypothetical protein
MGDKEVFMDPDQNGEHGNAEPRNNATDPDHAERVSGAFSSLEQKLGPRFTEEEQRVHGIREAAMRRDRREVEQHLAATKRESSWLYDELMKHPEISAIMRELSIMGF